MQPLRLTLRTLLAYLDDTLEPAQAKLIGQKIAESEQARELSDRIKTVTRRRRITTPTADDPGGKLDPNTVGEYLDNTVSPERAAEVEEICLASDAHLAEVAACHQILSLILGEPALVPAPARQRMYGLVKGPEAIPFRKPPASPRPDVVVTEARDIDDTLRLGIPPVTGQHRGNPWILAVGGVLAAGLLLFAIWQILKGPETPEIAQQPVIAAGNDRPNDKKKDTQVEAKPIVAPPIQPDDGSPAPEKKTPTPEVKKGEIELPPVQVDTGAAPPSAEQKVLGKFVFDAKEPGVLLERAADMNQWQRVGLKNPAVSSARPLVSLPTTTSVIQLASGLKLSLVGLAPELFPVLPLYESAVELHASDQVDLDMTLRRGRVRIISEKDKPANARVRFENPTIEGVYDSFNITLAAKGTEVLLDRWTRFDEKFYRNSKDPLRAGPTADMTVVVLSGSATVKANDVPFSLTAPPGKALLRWNSRGGQVQDDELKSIPDGLKGPTPLPQGADPRFRKDLLRARDDLSKNMATKPVDVVLTESRQGQDMAVRRLGVLSLGAINDFATLLDLLSQESEGDLRFWSMETLQNWIATSRDQEYQLYELLKTKYRVFEADGIMALLHGFSAQDVGNPDTYESLIGALDNPRLPVRELAKWRLYNIAELLMPGGAHRGIQYNAADPPAARQQAQRAWRKLIPPGKTPPMPKAKTK